MNGRSQSSVQLEEDNSVISPAHLTKKTLKYFDYSMEKQCKKLFDVETVPVPTNFIVLPYQLKMDMRTDKMQVQSPDHAELAERIGKCFLQMNKTTAKLSFWLFMKEKLSKHQHGSSFKAKLKLLLRRAQTEDSKSVAAEIVTQIGCGSKYVGICQEMLAEDEDISHAKAYLQDPIEKAVNEMTQSVHSILQCYLSQSHFFFLIDEYKRIPVASRIDYFGNSYPLHLAANLKMVEEVFLPFMNLSVMAAIAIGGLSKLASVLGLPSTHGIPNCWKEKILGQVHRADRPSNVASFGVLQRLMREYHDRKNEGRKYRRDPPCVLSELKKFYAMHDSARRFSDLLCVRVSGSKDSTGIWTSSKVLYDIKREIALKESFLREQEKKDDQAIQFSSQEDSRRDSISRNSVRSHSFFASESACISVVSGGDSVILDFLIKKKKRAGTEKKKGAKKKVETFGSNITKLKSHIAIA